MLHTRPNLLLKLTKNLQTHNIYINKNYVLKITQNHYYFNCLTPQSKDNLNKNTHLYTKDS